MATTTKRPRGVRMRFRESFPGGLFGDADRRQPARQTESYDQAKQRLGSVGTKPKKKRQSILEADPASTGNGEYDRILDSAGGKFVVR